MFPVVSRHKDDHSEEKLLPVLNKFYNEFAKPAKTSHLRDLRRVVDAILRNVEAIDGRFRCETYDVGSLASGAAAVVACEFDILLCLDIEGKDKESELSPGFAQFQLTESSAKRWPEATVGKCLHPRKLTDMFQRHVNKAVKSMGSELGDRYTVGGLGTVATTVAMEIDGFKYKADIVLAVKCQGWPASADAEWLQSGYSKPWPSRETISDIKRGGYEMVAKYVNKNTPGVGDEGPDLELLWRLSMSRAETLLLKTIDQGGTLCHIKVLVILKALRLNYLVSTAENIPKGPTTLTLTSYHLKTMLLLQAQAFPNPHQWTEDKLAKRFLSFLKDFHWRVQFEDLSPFFFPRVNLCKNRGIMFGGLWANFFSPLLLNASAYIESLLPVDRSTLPLYTIYNSL